MARQDDGNGSIQGNETAPMNPGDEAPPGTPGTGENICGHCAGKGRMPDGNACRKCGGTGKVIEGVGGG